MTKPIDRSIAGRQKRKPDLFISHSSRDKPVVRRLAEELAWCGIDVWLDEWELQAGESLHDVLAQAATKANFLGVIVGANFDDSPWANDELKIGLSREKAEKRHVVIPIVVGRQPLPAFLQGRVYIDLRRDRYIGIARLIGLLLKLPQQTVTDAILEYRPKRFSDLHGILRYCGLSPTIALNKEVVDSILQAGGRKTSEGCVEFFPEEIIIHPSASPHLRKLMSRLITVLHDEQASAA